MAHDPTPSDDDALSWEGDENVVAPLPRGWKAVGRGSEQVGSATPDVSGGADTGASVDANADVATSVGPQPMTNVQLLATGLLAGVYVLYGVGWFIGTARMEQAIPGQLADVMFQFSKWLAVAAPLIWFATVWLATRGRARWQQFIWLAAGAVLLIPWPFVMVGVSGQ